MTEEQLVQIKKSLRETVETTVNGKLDKLQRSFDEHAKEDLEWKERAQPALDVVNNARGFGKTLVYLLGIAAAIFAVIKGLNK